MARRMFSPKIVSSDIFLDMPTSARELYFQLGMNADDDGFVNPKRVMRMIGAADDDIKILIAKKFVIEFSSGVIVITHWKVNNLVRKDWYQQSMYLSEKSQLQSDENGAYILVNELGNGNVPNSSTQVRLGKVRLGKVKEIAAETAAPFVWDKYIKAMDSHSARHIQVIAFYFKKKNIKFDTLKKAQSAIRRHLRASKELANFNDSEIFKAYKTADADYKSLYTIETLLKILTR